jgi:anionic cell wall polymer biosynthesis LytR-Cps2A-Psr (LCP) family protein
LWFEDSKGYHMKINSVYAIDGVNNVTGEIDRAKGIEELTKIVGNVLGIPIHYHAMVNFQLFEDTINLLGGIDVNVETAFSDYEYPVEGKEADNCGRSKEDIEKDIEDGKSYLQATPCRYLTATFAAGPQTMDGVKALQFSRSRHGTNNEGTDFARARRQQKVIMAVKDKALSLQTLINPQKLKDLYELYAKNIDTNIDLGTLQNFYLLSQQISFDKVESVVLDDRSEANDGGLLYAPEDRLLYGGAYVLIPKTGDYSQIHAYVQKYLFGAK